MSLIFESSQPLMLQKCFLGVMLATWQSEQFFFLSPFELQLIGLSSVNKGYPHSTSGHLRELHCYTSEGGWTSRQEEVEIGKSSPTPRQPSNCKQKTQSGRMDYRTRPNNMLPPGNTPQPQRQTQTQSEGMEDDTPS